MGLWIFKTYLGTGFELPTLFAVVHQKSRYKNYAPPLADLYSHCYIDGSTPVLRTHFPYFAKRSSGGSMREHFA